MNNTEAWAVLLLSKWEKLITDTNYKMSILMNSFILLEKAAYNHIYQWIVSLVAINRTLLLMHNSQTVILYGYCDIKKTQILL